jgi:eukaryotic-like serine/threonine-protein kinase
MAREPTVTGGVGQVHTQAHSSCVYALAMHPKLVALAARMGWTPEEAAQLDGVVDEMLAETLSGLGLSTLAPAEAAENRHPVQADATDLSDPSERYTDLGPLGQGGMGEVRRVRDQRLSRSVAMKILRERLQLHPEAVARFNEEAQATAQLQHPGIVPVHDVGFLADGRSYFTMKEITGNTLSTRIEAVHAASGEGWQPSEDGWTFRRLIASLHQACEAVGYAHARGVVHRDLKPDNIMLGAHGEVLVVDWGLAKIRGRKQAVLAGLEPVVSARQDSGEHATRMGQVAGTPAYMPPEQAAGNVDQIDARADVYALGAILYEILSGRPPYQGTARSVVAQVLAGPPEPPGQGGSGAASTFMWMSTMPGEGEAAGLPVPAELVETCLTAMAREPEGRFAGATELATELAAWLDGARKREQAEATLRLAQEKLAEVARMRAEADSLEEQRAAIQAGRAARPANVGPGVSTGWELRKRAGELRADAHRTELEAEQLLYAAVYEVPDLDLGHQILAERQMRRHEDAFVGRDHDAAMRAVEAARVHIDALSEGNRSLGRFGSWLTGEGTIELRTEPPGAQVSARLARRLDERWQSWVGRAELGQTPLSVRLPEGSHLLTIQREGHAEVRVPVVVRRGQSCSTTRPGGTEPHTILLPRSSDIGHDERYVAAGWTLAGGRLSSDGSWLGRPVLAPSWVDTFSISPGLVTNAEYLSWLRDLVASGQLGIVRQALPGRSATRRDHYPFVVAGREIDLEGGTEALPVVGIDWFSASRFAAWRAVRTGRPWRLPTSLEWEKAARGVDGRQYPWASELRPDQCLLAEDRDQPGPSGEREAGGILDTDSVYGVAGMAGAVRSWCADIYWRGDDAEVPLLAPPAPPFPPPPELETALRAVPGRQWSITRMQVSPLGSDHGNPPLLRSSLLGIRLARSWPRPETA